MNAISFFYKVCFHTARLWPDKFYVKLQHKAIVGNWPDLENPKTFQEKLHWLKLHDHKPIYTTMVDKYEAKAFIEECVGKEYVIPTLGVYDNIAQIDYSALPNSFVIKTTHDSGTVIICKDKSRFNIKRTNKILEKSLRRNYYYAEREWPYKNVKPRIMVEPLLAPPVELIEFKLFCFAGEPMLFQSIGDRQGIGGPILQHFDMECNRLNLQDRLYKSRQDKAEKDIIPCSIDTLVTLSKKLSSNTSFLRVDFFEVNGKVYVGELTLYESGGYCDFLPSKWNQTLGDWIKLPNT